MPSPDPTQCTPPQLATLAAEARSSDGRRRTIIAAARRIKGRYGAIAALSVVVGFLTAATACSESGDRVTPSKGGAKNQGGESGNAGAAVAGASASTGGSATSGQGGGAAGAGATQAVAGGGGQTSAPTPVCTMPAKWVGALKPAPLVSVGKPVFTNSKDPASAGLIVDGQYKVKNGLVFNPSATTTTWVSIQVGAGSTRLLLNWQDTTSVDFGPSNYDGDDSQKSNGPLGYLVKLSADSTNGEDGTWTTAVTVTDNPVRSRRSHVLDFTGMSWVRFEVTAAPLVDVGGTPTMQVVRLDEIALHDISTVVPDDLVDTWFILGDSITKMSFDRARKANELDKLIAVQRPAFTPALLEAGNGGETLSDLLRHLKTEQWLSYGEGLKLVTLAYGTNDSWDKPASEAVAFEANLREVIQILADAKRVPVLTRIPWFVHGANVAAFNAVIDKLQKEFELPCGPDLNTWFTNHQEELGNDKVHPANPIGYNSVHRLYAEALLPLYPAH